MFEGTTGFDEIVRDRYLHRLGLEGAPPSVRQLHQVVNRHAERVPYETLWIQAGEHWTVDPVAAARRIALSGRGGYCYHLNGGLGLLLTSLGYSVRAHVGGVHGAERSGDERGNHLVLTVTGLPDDENPGGDWYVDTGLGDALHDPLPLVAGTYQQGPFRLVLEQLDADRWHLQHDPTGGFRGMEWTLGPARIEDFADKHTWLSTSPDSGFVQVPMAERRDATSVDVVRGLIRSRIGTGAYVRDPITAEADYFAMLADDFGIRFEPHTPQRERLWNAALAAHRAWETNQPV
jgi:N-hydroxyarylamine O-acetyltransferase